MGDFGRPFNPSKNSSSGSAPKLKDPFGRDYDSGKSGAKVYDPASGRFWDPEELKTDPFAIPKRYERDDYHHNSDRRRSRGRDRKRRSRSDSREDRDRRK